MGFKEFNSLCDKDRRWLERLCQQREGEGWEERVGAAAVTRVWNISLRPTGRCEDMVAIRAVLKIFPFFSSFGHMIVLPHCSSSWSWERAQCWPRKGGAEQRCHFWVGA